MNESKRKKINFRWLLAQGRTEEAKSILRKIADFNKKPLDVNFQLSPPPKQGSGGGRGILGFLELFKTPNLRMKTLIIYYLWFSTSMVYYGLTLNSNNVGNYFVTYSVGKGNTNEYQKSSTRNLGFEFWK